MNPGRRKEADPLPAIGWREWLALPDLGIERIKAKVDTGARSSALHAYDVEFLKRGGHDVVRFKVHPMQRNSRRVIRAEAPLLEMRHVRDSSGRLEERPVILTGLRLMDDDWGIELTLTRRDVMGFRMLLGRQAIRGRFAVDPARSYYNGKLRRERRARPKQGER